MNAAHDRYRLPQMRVCDAGRDGVAAALGEHVQTGRLTGEELDERTGRALRARTLAELDELTADVPAIRPAGPAPVARPRGLGYPLVAPVAAALAALAIAALVPGVGDGRHGWVWWWVIPAGLLVARRLAGQGGAHREPGPNRPRSEPDTGTATASAPQRRLAREPGPPSQMVSPERAGPPPDAAGHQRRTRAVTVTPQRHARHLTRKHPPL